MSEQESFWELKYDWESAHPVVWCYGCELISGTFPEEDIKVEYEDRDDSTMDWSNCARESKHKIPYKIVVHAYARDVTDSYKVMDLQKRALLRIAKEIEMLIDILECSVKTVTELNGMHLYSVDQKGALERK